MSIKKLEQYEELKSLYKNVLVNFKKLQDEELLVVKKRRESENELKKYEQQLNRTRYEIVLESIERAIDKEIANIEKNEYITTSDPNQAKLLLNKARKISTLSASTSFSNSLNAADSSDRPQTTKNLTSDCTTASSSHKRVTFAEEEQKNISREVKHIQREKSNSDKANSKNIFRRLFSCTKK